MMQEIKSWYIFETVVAKFYQKLGVSKIQQNVVLGGNEIDIYVEEKKPSGQTIRTAIECKYYKKKVPKDVVIWFSKVANFLRDADLIDKAVIVSYKGFDIEAFSAAKNGDIELRSFLDFETNVTFYERWPIETFIKEAEKTSVPDSFPALVFVLMPFSEQLDDLYLYGIRSCAEKYGLRCTRADEILHDNAVINEVIDHIKRARIIVAEISAHNPNVFYEVGWAYALKRTTILIAQKGTILPFDIAHINTIFYKNIKELEDKLSLKFTTIIKQDQKQ